MGHGHSHSHHHHAEPVTGTRSALGLALALNGVFLVVELAIGLLTGSLALLSDAAHMVSDVSALALALGAAQLARLSATPDRSYGWFRAETLGAFVNGLALVVACGFIFWEAGHRLTEGAPEILAWPVLLAGVLGLVINLGSAWVLYRADRDNLNIRGALIHMLADALGSVGAIVAALGMWAGVNAADAIVSVFIGLIVLWGTWGLLRDSARVLLQFAPAGLSVGAVLGALREVPGVEAVHELHVWTLDGKQAVLSAHLIGADGRDPCGLREAAEDMLRDRFGIRHTTLQTEVGPGCPSTDCPLMRRGHDHDHDHG
ncbi:MAG: cation transporter [Alphaproteobacteria bacterium]|nr:cation transporter [Alphaproteobacteria bacterium]